MLTITIPEVDLFDESKNEFVLSPETTIDLEHSLVSLSKWESKWEKPFLNSEDQTTEETLDYVKCMTLTENVSDDIYQHLTQENIDAVSKYIDAKMTATWFADKKESKGGRKEVITAEIIYYWMISLTIPFECQYWHLNRLLTLVKVCNEKNTPPDKRRKMSKSELAARNRRLNDQRRAQMKTSG